MGLVHQASWSPWCSITCVAPTLNYACLLILLASWSSVARKDVPHRPPLFFFPSYFCPQRLPIGIESWWRIFCYILPFFLGRLILQYFHLWINSTSMNAKVSCHCNCFTMAFGCVSKYFKDTLFVNTFVLWVLNSVVRSLNNLPQHTTHFSWIGHLSHALEWAYCFQKLSSVHLAWRHPQWKNHSHWCELWKVLWSPRISALVSMKVFTSSA